MVCAAFTGMTTVGDLLVWPTGCNYYFFLVGFFVPGITHAPGEEEESIAGQEPQAGESPGEPAGTSDAEGEEPSGEVKRLYELRDIMYSADTEEERVEAGKEVFRLHDENLWMIGTVRAPGVFIVGENMRNIPELGVAYDVSWNVEQVFFKE